MPEKHLYEYAVIRFVPKIERKEFMNVGIILFSKKTDYLKTRYWVNESKLKVFSSDLDVDLLHAHLEVFDVICTREKRGGTIALLDTAERFRWLTAIRSTSIQTSRPHPGFSSDLDQTFEILFKELVL